MSAMTLGRSGAMSKMQTDKPAISRSAAFRAKIALNARTSVGAFRCRCYFKNNVISKTNWPLFQFWLASKVMSQADSFAGLAVFITVPEFSCRRTCIVFVFNVM